jgi:hypothetical protein
MQSELRDACLAMFRSIRIESQDVVRIGDIKCRGVGANLVHWLQCQIYTTFFCSMNPAPSAEPLTHFVQRLASANSGAHSGRKESLTDQPGAYLAFGSREPQGTRWLRFYWNVTPAGAIVLTRETTSTLNRLQVPFRLKILLETAIRRRDSAVLYLPANLWFAARSILECVCRELDGSGDLQSDTPLFTKTLAPGVSLAEDPQSGWSFGMHRSWLVARSLVKSHVHSHQTDIGKLTDLKWEFAGQGLSLDRPYLNAGSADVYDLEPATSRRAIASSMAWPVRSW